MRATQSSRRTSARLAPKPSTCGVVRRTDDLSRRPQWAQPSGSNHQHSCAVFAQAGVSKCGPSAALVEGHVTSSHLVLVGGEGCEHFGLLAFRYLEDIQRPSKFQCDFVEFRR